MRGICRLGDVGEKTDFVVKYSEEKRQESSSLCAALGVSGARSGVLSWDADLIPVVAGVCSRTPPETAAVAGRLLIASSVYDGVGEARDSFMFNT